MIKLKHILKESIDKKLVVFDFDDTLMKTDSKVYITHGDGTKEQANADEWNKYEHRPGDTFNFDEFFKIDYLINPREIKPQMDSLRHNVKIGNDVWVLTNRENTNPIKKYFNSKGLHIGVYGTGTSNPQGKKSWFEEKIREGYKDIEFFDDSEKNIQMISSLKNKNINLELHLIK